MREVYLPLAPVPASRPRVSKWGTYYLKTYATWKSEADRMLKEAGEPGTEPWDCAVYVLVTIGAKRPKKPVNPWPPPDVDNYAKANLDAVQKCGFLIVDDKQVQVLLTSKRYVKGDEAPYSHIALHASLDGLVDAMYFTSKHAMLQPGHDVYDLPAAYHTPLHLLKED